MGLTFCVGNPIDTFLPSYAAIVKTTLESQFGGAIVLDSLDDAYFSAELGWSGWRKLQERAIEVLPASHVPHLLSMEAWCGCYVPTDTPPGSFEFENESTPLAVASLPALLIELKSVGTALGLPTDEKGLKELASKYQDDDLVDSDIDLQTYAQLLLAARVAERRKQVLWIVK